MTAHIAASSQLTSLGEASRWTGFFRRQGVRHNKGTRLAVQQLEE